MKSPMSRVKIFEQKKSGMCGPAALRTLLSRFKHYHSEDYLARMCGSSKTYGTRPQKIVEGLKKLGFKTRFGNWGKRKECWKKLHYWVDIKKIPVLVNWFSGYDGHYSVVVKITKKSIWLADPEFHCSGDRRRKMRWNDFFRAWFDFYGDYLTKDAKLLVRWWAVGYLEPLSDFD